mgnify:CR=1 FL=1
MVAVTGRPSAAGAVAASDWPKLTPLSVGQAAEIPQFIHYHLENGKFTRALCAVFEPPH